MEDMYMNEVSDIAFDHHQLRLTNDTNKDKDPDLGSAGKELLGHSW